MKECGPGYYNKHYIETSSDWRAYEPMYNRIVKYLPPDKNSTILDAACGVGGFLKTCLQNGYRDLYGVDFAKVAIQKAEELNPQIRERLQLGDITRITPELIKCGRRFDCIVLIEILEHIKKDKKVINDLMQFLTPSGFILGSVPNEQMGPEITPSHVRVYSERSFISRFNHPGRMLNRPLNEKQNFILFKFYKTIPDPRLSFVVPAYNGDYCMSRTVTSLVNQTIDNIEIIVINDASPDYTHDLMKWWRRNDCRIRYFRLTKNRGVVNARNFGNRKAQAPIIAVNDQDDFSLPQRAEVTLKTFEEHPEIDVLYSSYHDCDIDGEILAKYDAEEMNREIFEKHTFKTWFHSSAAYRKKDILRLPYRKVYGDTDDWVFLNDWTKANKKFYPIEEVLAQCVRLPTGVMHQRRMEKGLPPHREY